MLRINSAGRTHSRFRVTAPPLSVSTASPARCSFSSACLSLFRSSTSGWRSRNCVRTLAANSKDSNGAEMTSSAPRSRARARSSAPPCTTISTRIDFVCSRDLICVMIPQQLRSDGVASVMSNSGPSDSICSTSSPASTAISYPWPASALLTSSAELALRFRMRIRIIQILSPTLNIHVFG